MEFRLQFIHSLRPPRSPVQSIAFLVSHLFPRIQRIPVRQAKPNKLTE
jgi:hypothetical protein